MDLDVPFVLMVAVGTTANFYSNLAVVAVATWQVLFVAIPMVFLTICIQVTIIVVKILHVNCPTL